MTALRDKAPDGLKERNPGYLKNSITFKYRFSPKYKTHQVILIILLAFQLRIKSMNDLKYLLKENEFRNLFSSGIQLSQS